MKDPLKGVVNPDSLVAELKKLAAGDRSAKSYIRGSLQVLEWKTPNPFIVPLLKRALRRSEERNQ